MNDICTDNRYEIIERARADIIEATNIETSPKEMEVLNNILFRAWQMGWLKQYETYEAAAPFGALAQFNNKSNYIGRREYIYDREAGYVIKLETPIRDIFLKTQDFIEDLIDMEARNE